MLLKTAFVWGAEPYGFPKTFLAAPLLCLLRRQITMFIHKEKATMTILFVVFLSLLFKSFKQETCQLHKHARLAPLLKAQVIHRSELTLIYSDTNGPSGKRSFSVAKAMFSR